MNPGSVPPITLPCTGFLTGFLEIAVEKPLNGLDGDCVVHYGGDYSDHIMMVKLVNGKREGTAIIVNEDYEFIKLEYRRGELTGDVVKMDRYLSVLLKGSLVNGEERGLFVEYKGSKPIWRGYYRNGKRFSEVVKSVKLRWYYEERSVRSRLLLSIAQYDESLRDKNGHCFEFENGVIKRECIYENGERKETVREFQSDAEMTYTPPNQSFLRSLFEKPCDDSLILHNLSDGSGYGVLRSTEKCYEIQWIPNDDRVIEVDLIRNEVRGYQNTQLIDVHCCQEVMDLSVNGRRWEGGVREGKPFGYGILFNEEGQKEYEGFMIDQTKIGFGQDYYSDIDRVEYSGCYFDGKRYGFGILFDRNGAVDYEGLWKDDKPYVSSCNGNVIDNHVDSLVVGCDAFSEQKSFVLSSSFDTLKQVVIADNSLQNVSCFKVKGLNELESIVVGKSSFKVHMIPFWEWKRKRVDGVFQIADCPKLQTITIGDTSFFNYGSFDVDKLPSLQSLQIGDSCFVYAPVFSLTGLIGGLAK